MRAQSWILIYCEALIVATAAIETSPVGIILMQNRRRARAIAIAKTESTADIKLRLSIIAVSAIVAILTISQVL
ncbi:hypothetical protein ACRQ1B_09100 [Rhizobium panacihumi]|uniref:hypothetical protein n=1 Tax=Rhizobium panacihumi TaxID=2008450 RepID=UPI003D7AC657